MIGLIANFPSSRALATACSDQAPHGGSLVRMSSKTLESTKAMGLSTAAVAACGSLTPQKLEQLVCTHGRGGPATIRNSNGGTWLGEVSGDVDVRAANGRISVERAAASVAARTACGDIFLGEVGSGTVAASTSWGRVEVGVRTGAVAWLDLQTRAGKLVNELDSSAPRSADEGAVHPVARTSAGEITVRRA